MSNDVTPPTWTFTFRGDTEHKAILLRVVEAHAKMGLKISLNQAMAVLIRRGATPDADTEEEARAQIEHHWADCPHGCTSAAIKCPEGWRLRDAFLRVHDREALGRIRRARTAHPSPTPPPPPEEGGARRYFGFAGRRAS